MNREEHAKQCIVQHLSNKKCCERISEKVAEERMNESMNEFLHHVKNPKLKLSNEDTKCL